ncbi:pyridoxal phosphate-dependent transferase [Tuber brumale]|nr:pyridoxal phosphate-dependent transferase [Tuber brumale]
MGVLKKITIIATRSRPICLDTQVTTPTVPHVFDTMLSVYTGLYRDPYSCTHTYGWETMKAIDVASQQAAKLLGAYPMEIMFTPAATESNKLLIKYVAMIYKFKKHIITSPTEHMCVLDSFRHLQDKEYDYKYLLVVNNGLLDREHSEKVICPDTAPVSIVMVDNEIGVIQPMEEVGELCRKNRDFFCTRSAQSVGNNPVDVGKWNDDLMGISGPKVYRSKDIGTRYTRNRPKVRIDPLISGSGQGRGLRSGTHAHSLVFAFGGPGRISPEEYEYTRTPNPFFSQNSICFSAMQGNNYIHKHYHKTQSGQFTRTLWTMGHHKADMKRSKSKATTEDSRVVIQEDNLTSGVDASKRRNRKWTTSYSNMTIRAAEKRLGIRFNMAGIPPKKMLEGKIRLLGPDTILKVKRRVYQNMVDYLEAGGYPGEDDPDFKEANISVIVAATIYPTIAQFKRETKRALHISCEKEITSTDSSTSGIEEFVVMDYISYDQMRYVLVVEAKKASLGEATKHCFLSLKDMWDCNGGGTVYGFVTMGDFWRMVSFDGTFKRSQVVGLLFETMAEEEERWIADYSIVVDCLNVALSNGGKDPGEVV